jgi:hypothetical protein
MKKNVIRKILGGLSLTSAMFVFQACYGTPKDFGLDLFIEGQVKSKASGLPIKGIKVSIVDSMQYEMTDEDGKFSFYTEKLEGLTLSPLRKVRRTVYIFSPVSNLLINNNLIY